VLVNATQDSCKSVKDHALLLETPRIVFATSLALPSLEALLEVALVDLLSQVLQEVETQLDQQVDLRQVMRQLQLAVQFLPGLAVPPAVETLDAAQHFQLGALIILLALMETMVEDSVLVLKMDFIMIWMYVDVHQDVLQWIPMQDMMP